MHRLHRVSFVSIVPLQGLLEARHSDIGRISESCEISVRKMGFPGATMLIPKLYLRLLWFFRRTAALFRQIRTFPQLFRFCADLGNPGVRQIVTNSMLTGR